MRDLQISYSPHYLSIQDILASNERIPCRFINELPKMGFLDSSSDNENLSAGTNVELPYWLGEALFSKRPPMVSVDIPKVYKEAYREILKAEASVVDLHKLGMFYYDFGAYISSFDPRAEVAKSLVMTFRNRFRYIMDLSQNARPDAAISSGLERLELLLLEGGQKAGQSLRNWCRYSTMTLQPAPLLSSHLKRKRPVENEQQ